jgi:hypothetical protein
MPKNSTDFAPRRPNRVNLRPLPTTTSGELTKLRKLMRPKHSLVWLLTAKTSGVHDLMGSFTAHPAEEMPSDVGVPGARPVTSFLFLRYRLQSFKVGAEILDWDGMIIVIS